MLWLYSPLNRDHGAGFLQHAMVIDSRNSSILPRRGALLKVNQVGFLLLGILHAGPGAGGTFSVLTGFLSL